MKLYFSAILETLIALSVKCNKKIKGMGDILHPSNDQDGTVYIRDVKY